MKVFDYYHKFLKVLMVSLFMCLAVVVSYQLISRNVDGIPRFSSTEEISRWLFVWVIFVGAAIGVRENSHFVVDLFSGNSLLNKYLDLISTIVVCLVALLLIVMGYKFVGSGLIKVSPMSGLSFFWPYLAIPFSGLSMLVFTIEKFLTFNNKEIKSP